MADKMTDSQLSTIVSRKVDAAVGFVGGTLSKDRKKALQYYRGEPIGNEVQDRSQVVSQDVAEAIESMMPSLLEIFASGDQVVKFEPTQQEDEEGAEQASDYCNWIWNQQNDGFRVFYWWFKDALLQRLGTIKIWWDTEQETVKERYEGLTADELKSLQDDDDVEVISIVPQGAALA